MLVAIGQFVLVTAVAFLVACVITSIVRYDIAIRGGWQTGKPAPTPPEELLRVEIASRLKRPAATVGLVLVAPKTPPPAAGLKEMLVPRLAATLRTTDKLMWLTEDTLAVLLDNCSAQGLSGVVDRISEALSSIAPAAWRLSALPISKAYPRTPAEAIQLVRTELPATGTAGIKLLESQDDSEWKTPLLDPQHYLSELQRYAAYFRRAGSPLSLVVTEPDNLPRYRRHYGPDAIEQVVQSVGTELQNNLRWTDFLARTGPESFLICLPIPLADAVNVARRLARIIRGLDIPYGRETLRITASFGVAASPEHGRDLRTVIGCSQQAMEEARRAGPGRVSSYSKPAARETPESQRVPYSGY